MIRGRPVQCAHISKHSNELTQNGTQDKTPFIGTVSTLSHGVIRFVGSVCPRSHSLTGKNSLGDNQKLLLSWFSKLTLGAKWITPCVRA